VVQALQADLAAGRPDGVQRGRIDGVGLGHEEPGRDHGVARFDLEQPLHLRESQRSLHVVGQHVCEAVTLGPQSVERRALGARPPQSLA
jgi:hypothetical protein